MKRYTTSILILIFVLINSLAYCQTYSRIIADEEYYDFVNKDILRDSVKVKHHIFRERFRLILDDFYYENAKDIDSISRRNNQFLFSRLNYGDKILTNHLDTIFTRADIDYFAAQIQAMTSDTTWKSPLSNSVFIDRLEYNKKRPVTRKRQPKWGYWRYSLPLFSFDKRFAIIIKSNSVGGAYYIYKRNEKDEWILIRIVNQWAECYNRKRALSGFV